MYEGRRGPLGTEPAGHRDWPWPLCVPRPQRAPLPSGVCAAARPLVARAENRTWGRRPRRGGSLCPQQHTSRRLRPLRPGHGGSVSAPLGAELRRGWPSKRAHGECRGGARRGSPLPRSQGSAGLPKGHHPRSREEGVPCPRVARLPESLPLLSAGAAASLPGRCEEGGAQSRLWSPGYWPHLAALCPPGIAMPLPPSLLTPCGQFLWWQLWVSLTPGPRQLPWVGNWLSPGKDPTLLSALGKQLPVFPEKAGPQTLQLPPSVIALIAFTEHLPSPR